MNKALLTCRSMHVGEEGSHLALSAEWNPHLFDTAGLVWCAKMSPKPHLLKVKKDAKKEKISSLHTSGKHHLSGCCPEKEINLQKSDGLHHIFNWLQTFPEHGHCGQRQDASSLHELHIAATNNALPEYGNCQPESKYDSDYFKAAH